MSTIGVLNGPNLDRLGDRDSRHYGGESLSEIREGLRTAAAESGSVELLFYQSNHEGDLLDWLAEHSDGLDGLLVNAGALTHTSVALRDGLEATELPFVEVHLSNIHAREPFRRRSLLSDLAVGLVAGFRGASYRLALAGLLDHLERSDAP